MILGEDDSSEASSTVFPIYEGESEIGINTIPTPTSSNVTPNTSNRQDIPPPDWNNGYLPPQPMPPIQPQPCFQTTYRCCPSYNPFYPMVPQNPEYIPNTPQIPPLGIPNYPGGNQNPLYPVPPIGSFPSYPQYPEFIPNTPSIPPGYYPPSNPRPWSPIEKFNLTKQVQQPQISPYPPFGYPLQPNPIIPNPSLPTPYPGLQQCCRNYFTNRRFYLVSPNFPVPNRRPTDCLYVIDRASPTACRLRIEFKFYNHGNDYQCFEDFLEIDGQRICGCKSGLVYTSQWGFGPKVIRYRNTGYESTGFRGFVLDVIQESCPYRYEMQQRAPLKRIDQNPASSYTISKANQIGQTMVRTNSSSISTYYHFADPEDSELSQRQQIGVVNEKIPVNKEISNDSRPSETEIETAKFFYMNPGANNGQFRCNLNPIEWLFLKKSALFIQQPICFRY